MKNKEKSIVDWQTYAEKYDMLLNYNPFYQELRQEVLEQLDHWDILPGGYIADLGAGTGNYSVEIAKSFPYAQIFHIDNNPGMNARAANKATALQNFHLMEKDIDEVHFEQGTLQGLVCINAIYTFPHPRETLRRIYDWLAPNASAVLVDPGRIMSTLSWKIAIGKHLIKTYGLAQTLAIMREGRAVSKQNEHIRAMQQNGTFWTHSHEEFCQVFRQIGFRIEMSKICFRGDCDLVVVRKPKAVQVTLKPYPRTENFSL